MAECVEQYVEGRNAWQIGFLGFLIRMRGLLITGLFTLLTMGTPFWWPTYFSVKYEIQLKYFFLFFIFLVGGILLFVLYYVRNKFRRSLDIQHHLHELSHFLRDYQTKIYKLAMNAESVTDDNPINLRTYSDNICERVKDCFSKIANDSTIEVAIRLANDDTDREGIHEINYITVGRSSGLNSRRNESTEAVSSKEGIPRFFSDKDSQGVLIYNDLNKAAKIGAYKITINDSKYADEIKTMMVAPLNAWDSITQSMIGILYITSRESNTFSVKYVDSMRFVADMIAQSMSFYVNEVK